MKEKALPEGWEIRPLEYLVDILDAKRIPVNNAERETRIAGKSLDKLYPYFGATGEVGKIDGYLFDEELIALGEDGVPFFDSQKNKAYLLTGKTWVNNHAHVLRAKDNIAVNQYLLYYLNQFDYQGYVNGATRLKLTQANMRKIPVITAPFEQQQKLAKKFTALLSQVAEIKQRLEKIPALLKTYRQSVLARAVNGELSAKWREENGVSLESWAISTLKNLTTKIGSGSTPKGAEYLPEGVPFIRSLNIYTHFIKFDDLAFINDEQAQKLKNVVIEQGDLLLNITGASIGRVNIAPKEFIGGRVNQHVAIIRSKLDKIRPHFLHIFFASPKIQKWINDENYGSTRQALTKGMLEELKIAVPSLEEQNYITQAVEKHLNFANQLEAQVNAALERVNLMTQAILAKGFRGELL